MTKTERKQLQRAYKKVQLRTADKVARALGVFRTNHVLFPAVASALGQNWNDGTPRTKIRGYALVMEYAERHGIPTAVVVKPTSQAQLLEPRKAALPKVARDEFLVTFQWRRLRMEVLKKRGARCECCGASPKDGRTVLNVDHIKPRKLFPELALEESNLQVLCHECNHGKGNWDQTDWRGTA